MIFFCHSFSAAHSFQGTNTDTTSFGGERQKAKREDQEFTREMQKISFGRNQLINNGPIRLVTPCTRSLGRLILFLVWQKSKLLLGSKFEPLSTASVSGNPACMCHFLQHLHAGAAENLKHKNANVTRFDNCITEWNTCARRWRKKRRRRRWMRKRQMRTHLSGLSVPPPASTDCC